MRQSLSKRVIPTVPMATQFDVITCNIPIVGMGQSRMSLVWDFIVSRFEARKLANDNYVLITSLPGVKPGHQINF